MTELWLRVDGKLPVEKKMKLLEKASELCDAVVVSSTDAQLAKNLRARKVVSEEGGDVKLVAPDSAVQPILWEAATNITVKNRSDEVKVVKAAEKGIQNIIVNCPDWKVIPLENLIAQLHGKSSKLFAHVSNVEEATVAAETLELGVDGVLLETEDLKTLVEASKALKEKSISLILEEAEVTNVKILNHGARVCIDTVSLMSPGEGLLVGSQSSGLFLVQAEVIPNPHVEPRPFRVNAGPVSSYILASGDRTRYLSELKAGDEALIVNRGGETRATSIGRVKIELRPLLLVEAAYKGMVYKVILQNAETIHLVTKDSSIPVTELKPGDKVLIRHQPGGRHFGTLVEAETVIEK